MDGLIGYHGCSTMDEVKALTILILDRCPATVRRHRSQTSATFAGSHHQLGDRQLPHEKRSLP
jgi:hypothetical protein